MDRIELIQFAYSHYNEKARWALDYKKIAHTRTTLLPGPHARDVQKMTGATLVPVLRIGDEVVAGSAPIIDALEKRSQGPSLYPDDPEDRRRALEVQADFDEKTGPLVRRSLFAILVNEPGYTTSVFAGHRSLPVRLGYRAALPLVKPRIVASMGLGKPGAVEEADRGTLEALDLVARESARTGYLVGDRFTVADLTAAALLSPAVDPPDSPMEKPTPRPPSVTAWLERWQDHPGTAWVREIYRKHRPADRPGGVHGS